MRKAALWLGLWALPSTSVAFSLGSPICDVNVLPLIEMSPTLASPAPSGWGLRAETSYYVPGRALRVAVTQPDPNKRARGVLVFAKTSPFSGVGSFALPPNAQYQYIPPPAQCGEWSISHTNADPKTIAEMQWDYTVPLASNTVVLRAFVIEDCGLGSGGCRDQQALSNVVLLLEAIQVDGFE